MLQDCLCDECRLAEEPAGHVLWNCRKAQAAWDCSKVVASFGVPSCFSFHDLLWHMLMHDRVEDAKVAKVFTIARALWCNRNEVRNGGKWSSGREMVN